jgi:hypothetical protein
MSTPNAAISCSVNALSLIYYISSVPIPDRFRRFRRPAASERDENGRLEIQPAIRVLARDYFFTGFGAGFGSGFGAGFGAMTGFFTSAMERPSFLFVVIVSKIQSFGSTNQVFGKRLEKNCNYHLHYRTPPPECKGFALFFDRFLHLFHIRFRGSSKPRRK